MRNTLTEDLPDKNGPQVVNPLKKEKVVLEVERDPKTKDIKIAGTISGEEADQLADENPLKMEEKKGRHLLTED